MVFFAQQLKKHFQEAYSIHPPVLGPRERRRMQKCVSQAKKEHLSKEKDHDEFQKALILCRETHQPNIFNRQIF